MMMTELELINKIKQLKQIKPEKDWVFFTKNQILGEETYRERVSVHFGLKPVFVAVTAVMLLFAGIAGFFYLTEKLNEIVEVPAEPEPAKMIVLALEDLQKQVTQATEVLKKINGPQNVLEARNVIVPTIEAARKVIVEVEKIEAKEEGKVLAVKVNELESALDGAVAIQAKQMIQYLETRTLTETQQEILEKAKQGYEVGNYLDALINCLFINQLIR